MFVDARGDFEEPAVLRELQRFSERVRTLPGVAGAWSAADLFAGVDTDGAPARGLPSSADEVRAVLAQARLDPAVALELAPDHHEALVVVRFQATTAAVGNQPDVIAEIEAYARRELRASLVAVDLRDPRVFPATRGLAKGLLASDTRDRVARLMAAAGRPLTPFQLAAVDRVARETALIPTADPPRLTAELAEEARALVVGYPVPLRAAEQTRLVAALVALPFDGVADDVVPVVAAAYGERLTSTIRGETAAIWARRLADVRRRHTARLDLEAMVTATELPAEGALTDAVKGATLDGMGPAVGVPVPAGTPGAHALSLLATGGAALDAALSIAWFEGLRLAPGLVVVWALLLLVVGGLDGLTWLPVALAPGAAAALAAAVVREPLGLWGLAFLGGALAAGGVTATAFAARRRP